MERQSRTDEEIEAGGEREEGGWRRLAEKGREGWVIKGIKDEAILVWRLQKDEQGCCREEGNKERERESARGSVVLKGQRPSHVTSHARETTRAGANMAELGERGGGGAREGGERERERHRERQREKPGSLQSCFNETSF